MQLEKPGSAHGPLPLALFPRGASDWGVDERMSPPYWETKDAAAVKTAATAAATPHCAPQRTQDGAKRDAGPR